MATSHCLWEGACRRLGQSSKVAPCFFPKLTLFLSPRISLWPVGVLTSSTHLRGEALLIFWEFIRKLCRKNWFFMQFYKQFCQNHFGAPKRIMFFLPSPNRNVGRRVQKVESKFQGSPREAHEERPKRVRYSLGPNGLRGGVEFISKSNLVFLTWNIA